MSFIINHIKKNVKTKQGRRQLILEGVVLMIGIMVLLIVSPKTVNVPTYIVLLNIGYIFYTIHYIVKSKTNKSLDNTGDKK